MKVIIFTEKKVGEGHFNAAKAVEHAFGQLDKDNVETEVISGLSTIHPLVEWFCVQSYFWLLRCCPSLWGVIYKRSRKSKWIQTYFFAYQLSKVIEQRKPDLIICTHPACVPALNRIKRDSPHLFKWGVIFTDYDFHPFYVSMFCDYFFVGTSAIKEKLQQEYHIPTHKIFVYGIPLRPEFEEGLTPSTQPFCPSLASSDLIQVLLLGGATGHGPIEEVIRVLEPYHEQIQLTIIAGKNKALYRRLNQKKPSFVQVLGYVTNMKEWLSTVDIVISKPGGLTVTETLACGTPVMLIKPIPGPEEANASYLEKQGLAIYVERLEDLPDELISFIRDPQRWNEWRTKCKNHHKRGAAGQIVDTIMQFPTYEP